ncbi:MAG: hypothetical protein HOP09_14725 [Hyphomicrobium sp.]|nr:hypothetical protein [Hyphomicrobium sp.]
MGRRPANYPRSAPGGGGSPISGTQPGDTGSTFTDTGSVCLGTPTWDSDGYAVFSMENPANVSATPGTGAYHSWALKDSAGATSELDLDDLFAGYLAQNVDAVADFVDRYVFVAATLGALSPTSPGVAWGLRYNTAGATGLECVVWTNTGAGWTLTAAAARNNKTVGALLKVIPGTDDGQARVSCEGCDAAWEPNTTTSVPIVNSGAATNGNFDTISVGAGWVTGTGGVAGVQKVRLDYLLTKRELLLIRARKALQAISFPTSTPLEIAVKGQSNAFEGAGGAGAADPTFSGQPIPGTAAWVRVGTPVVGNYRTATDPVGPIPYLHLAYPNSRIVQQAGGGENVITQIETRLPALVADYRTLGVTPKLLVYVQGEEETTNPVASRAAKYAENLDRYLRAFWGHYPDCFVVLMRLFMRSNDYTGVGLSTHWPTVIDAQDLMGAASPVNGIGGHKSRLLVVDPYLTTPDPVGADVVHYQPSAAGWGRMVDAIPLALAGA